MSKTYCRFCELRYQGLYLNCPRCGKWLPPKDLAPGSDIEPDNDEYEVVSDSKDLKQKQEKP